MMNLSYSKHSYRDAFVDIFLFSIFLNPIVSVMRKVVTLQTLSVAIATTNI